MVSLSKGPLRAFRVADARYRVLDGSGAARLGGRWNSPGRRVIYGAVCYAGALLERLAQAGVGVLPSAQHSITIDIPDTVDIESIDADDLPGWGALNYRASRAYGDAWLSEARSAVLVVPSVIGRPHEQNVVINQDHSDFGRLRTGVPEPVRWDSRLR